MSVAFIFPGQGSQYVGMGKALCEKFEVARDTFEEANETLGFNLRRLCFEGPEEELTKTENTQPAIVATSIAALRVLRLQAEIKPSALAGHSLGEYSSLVASDAMRLSDAIKVVRLRGRFMQEAVPLGKGTMAAIIGLSPEEVETICEEAREDEALSIANLNCPGQIVIAGHTPAVDRAMTRATERDALKVVRLAVSAPFHSQLMGPAAERLAQALEDVPVYNLQVPVISNADAEYYPSKDEIKALLVKQVDHPVRWEESMRRMASDGVDQIIEVGPGRVLSGLMRRITRDVKTFNFESPEGAAKLPRA